jgi:aminoglycoside/choline kinase family phosphotransferase
MVNGLIMILKKFKLFPLPGDASFRQYYRKFDQRKKISTIIVVSKKEKNKNLLVYSAINQFLLNHNIKAPRLLTENYKNGFIEIEDLGNTTIHNIIKKSRKKFHIYRKTVDLLIKLQKIKLRVIKNFLGKSYKLENYSVKILHRESDLFFDWYLPLVMKKNKALKIKKILKKKLQIFYKNLKLKKKVFVHRDFHVSNLMKINSKIGVIDSQDAIIGNPTYDLLSLIDDVRIKTSNQLKKNIFNYYLNKSPQIYRRKKNDFIHDFNILSVQRNLKIIGIFSRLFKRDKKEKYLKLIPYSWKLLETRLKDKMFSEINTILNQFIPSKIRSKIKFYAN